jgi:hypothetical protein
LLRPRICLANRLTFDISSKQYGLSLGIVPN